MTIRFRLCRGSAYLRLCLQVVVLDRVRDQCRDQCPAVGQLSRPDRHPAATEQVGKSLGRQHFLDTLRDTRNRSSFYWVLYEIICCILNFTINHVASRSTWHCPAFSRTTVGVRVPRQLKSMHRFRELETWCYYSSLRNEQSPPLYIDRPHTINATLEVAKPLQKRGETIKTICQHTTEERSSLK